MEPPFGIMTPEEVDRHLVGLGFKKANNAVKSKPPELYSETAWKWRVITYTHPNKKEKVKVTIINGAVSVCADREFKQRTAWKNLNNVRELRIHFKL